MAKPKARTAILFSGRGSNLAALIAASREPGYPAEIVLAIANRPEAAGLDHARAAGVPAIVVDHRVFQTKAEFEVHLDAALRDADVDLICLAGFMRILSRRFADAWRDRVLNIHPSLLPAFPGVDTHRRALESGAERHGATVHFVRAETDAGPIIVQGGVTVRMNDTPDALAARVLAIEHRLYPLALKLVANGQARVESDRVRVPETVRKKEPGFLWPD